MITLSMNQNLPLFTSDAPRGSQDALFHRRGIRQGLRLGSVIANNLEVIPDNNMFIPCNLSLIVV